MMKKILAPIIVLLMVVGAVTYSRFSSNDQNENLGASRNYVEIPDTTLFIGAILGDTTITVDSLTDIYGNSLTMSDFGDKGYGRINPEGDNISESFSFSGITSNSDGTKTLTGVKTVLAKSPYTETSGLVRSHGIGSIVRITNTAGFYNDFTNKNNSESIEKVWTFNQYPAASSLLGNATTSLQFITLAQANSIGNQGAATATPSIAGISEEATIVEIASSTQFDANNPHYISSEYSTSTPTYSCNTTVTAGALCLPVAKNNGKLHQSWFDLTESYAWSGIHSWSSTSSVSFGGVTMNASSTANALPITMRNGELDFGFVSNVNVSVTTTVS